MLTDQWQEGTIAINGTSTGAIDLKDNYEFLQIILPALASGTLKLQVSDSVDGTYQDLGNGVTTAATTGSYTDTWLLGGHRFIKVVSSGTQITTARTIKVRGLRY